MHKWAVEYEPRIQDPVIVAKFDTQEEANAFVAYIQDTKPKTGQHCTVVEIVDA